MDTESLGLGSCACTRRRPARAGATACLRLRKRRQRAVLICRRRKPLDKCRASRADYHIVDVSGSTPYGQHIMPFERNRRHRWSWQDKSQSHGSQPSSMRHVSAHLLLRAPTAGRLLASTAELPRPLRRCSVKVRPPKRCAWPSPRGPERHDRAAHYPRRVSSRRHVEKALLELHVVLNDVRITTFTIARHASELARLLRTKKAFVNSYRSAEVADGARRT